MVAGVSTHARRPARSPGGCGFNGVPAESLLPLHSRKAPARDWSVFTGALVLPFSTMLMLLRSSTPPPVAPYICTPSLWSIADCALVRMKFSMSRFAVGPEKRTPSELPISCERTAVKWAKPSDQSAGVRGTTVQ